MGFPLSLNQEQYEALVSLARTGAQATSTQLEFEDFLIEQIEKPNGINRYYLRVRWQEADQPLPPTTRFPFIWPPELERQIILTTRPIARADVDQVLTQHARTPVNIMVTPDPAGIVGWTQLADYFVA